MKGKTSRMLLTIIAAAAITAILIAGCAAPATPAAPTAPAAPTPAKVQDIKMSTWSTVGYGYNAVALTAKAIEQASDGRFKCTVMPGNTVAPLDQHLFATQKGVFDTCYLFEALWMEYINADAVLCGIAHTVKTHADNWELWAHRGFKELRVRAYAPYNVVPVGMASYDADVFFSSKPIPNLAALKGMKISSGGGRVKPLASLGAEALSLPDEEAYTNLASGLIDAAAFANVPTIYGLGMYEVAKHWLAPELQPASVQVLMANKDFFNTLSAGDQYLIETCFNNANAIQEWEMIQQTKTLLAKAQAENGVIVYHWSDEDWKKWAQANLEFAPKYPDDPLYNEAWNILMQFMKDVGYL